MLRTKIALILSACITITLITSAYNVVHCRFVPGLGLKINCVLGKLNHLSLYIDNLDFYYNQCAKICDWYHHHMLIRVCALNYEHFLLWWQIKELPKCINLKNLQKIKVFS